MSLDVEAGKAAVAALELLAAAVLHVPELGDAYTGGKVVFYPSLKLVTIERIGEDWQGGTVGDRPHRSGQPAVWADCAAGAAGQRSRRH